MEPIGPSDPYYLTVFLWLGRTAFFSLACALLLWLGIQVLDALTPKIHERQKIGESPIATGLFLGGFLIFTGLVIHGAATVPILIGASFVKTVFCPTRLGLVAAGFLLSVLVGAIFINVVGWITRKITLASINKEPVAVGLYVFGYLIFFGLVLNAALTTPL